MKSSRFQHPSSRETSTAKRQILAAVIRGLFASLRLGASLVLGSYLVLWLCVSARAQLVADSATNTLSNVTTNITGDVTVGTNGSFTLLILSDNALLTNSANGIIGRNAAAKSNEVGLVSATARWQMGSNLFVGNTGPFNRLIVSNGAFLDDYSGFVGRNAGSSNNLALVTGNGSRWTNRGDLVVGTFAGGNQLVVSDGGVMRSASSVIGYLAGANSNAVTVTGPGAAWNVAANLQVGLDGVGNQVVASNGGSVFAAGQTALGTGSGLGANMLTVTGSGSVWSNATDFIVGYSSPGNRLVVSNGATVFAEVGVIGLNTGAKSNSVTVTDAGSSWLLSTYILVGSNSTANRLVISNGAHVVISNSFNVLLGYEPDASNNLMIVTGPGSLWRNDNGQVIVGSESAGNQLIVSNGAVVQDLFGKIGGFDLSASNNTVIVTDAGSLWTNARALFVGEVGSSNQLFINNGGTVAVTNVVYVGYYDSSTNNRVIVNGGTLRATNANGTAILDVRRGTIEFEAGTIEADQLVLTNVAQSAFQFNGGTLITRGALITHEINFQSLVVGDTGTTPAVWDVRAGGSNYLSNGLIVGKSSSFNRLVVTNGAQLYVAVADTIVGNSSQSRSNSVVISGLGSRLEAPDSVFDVGLFGSYNQMLLSDSGSARISHLYVGNDASNNSVVVTGAGSFLDMLPSADIGYLGSENRLVISNGAGSLCGFLEIGNKLGASGNELVVTGLGSFFTNTGDLYVGDRGSANLLTVANGATVVSSNVYLGFSMTSTNNRVVVDGGTLLVTNASIFSSGYVRRLDVRSGTNVLNSGLIVTPLLLVTNSAGQFEFNGGTLKSASTSYANGRILAVGNGVTTATFQLLSGTHAFANGIAIANNATLTGAGTIVGTMAVSSGGTLSPGDGIGTLVFSNTPNLGGTVLMEAFKLGATKLNDQIQVAGTLFYGGSLIVSNVGTAFNAGDNFKLFNASVFGGMFSSLILPQLNAGLGWTNKLLLDGSIEVIPVSLSEPRFSGISVSGTNVILSGTNGTAGANYAVLTATNVTTPSSNWVSLATNQFGPGGVFSFTNAIAPAERQRYFRIRTP